MKKNVIVWMAALALVVTTSLSAAFAADGGAHGTMTVYKSPLCGCCGGWVDYMRENGFSVRVKEMEDVSTIKEFLGIHDDLWSCHTATIDNYAIEGHVTVDAVMKILNEKPKIRGIALPGMPQGSPGMGGAKDEEWVTYTITDTEPQPFMTE
ncbi:MAG: DUF411 domain-containing protein [Rhodospirillales bacterium]|nr:DUF411 domain-containing protein [Rhodospirillales bacterium]